MSETEYSIPAPRGFWEKLMDSLRGRRREPGEELPADSLFALAAPAVVSMADVPETVKTQIRDVPELTEVLSQSRVNEAKAIQADASTFAG